MAVNKVFAVFLLLAVAVGHVTSQNCYPPCSVVRGTFFYPNWDDCNSYYKCDNGQESRQYCNFGQVFDFSTFTCRTKPAPGTFTQTPVFSCDVLLHGIGSG